MSFLVIQEVRSEHVVSRAPESLPANAAIPAWLDIGEDVVAVAIRALDGSAVTEVRRANGRVKLHEPGSGRLLSPLPAETAELIARRAWTGPDTSISAVTLGDNDATRVYIDVSSGAVLAARSDTWRLFDFIWGLHIMYWTQRDRINSWWLLLFGIGGTIIAVSGFVLLANRFPRIRRRAKHVPNAP